MRIHGDSHLASVIEGWANTAIGYILSVAAGYYIYPLFGWVVSVLEVSGLTAIFTALSFARSYGVRRLFIWMWRS